MFQPPEHHSKPFQLYPGITGPKGEAITECVVRLLTRKDEREIAACLEGTRDDARLARQIARLGSIADRSELMSAVEHLALVDELRIRQKAAELEAECLATAEAPPLTVRKIVSPTDIISGQIALAPGVFIGDQWQKFCIVKLLTRGEWKQMQAEQDEIKRVDTELYLSVVQFGTCTKVEPSHIDQLTDGDVGRIMMAIEELAAQYAPLSKSE